jgi:hypothetical protein
MTGFPLSLCPEFQTTPREQSRGFISLFSGVHLDEPSHRLCKPCSAKTKIQSTVRYLSADVAEALTLVATANPVRLA